jgi:mRNA interferase RelE/StbE
LRKRDKTDQRRLIAEIDRLALDPRPAGCKKLVGHEDLWRIRVSAFRIVYRINDDAAGILVLTIAHRREVYEAVKRL